MPRRQVAIFPCFLCLQDKRGLTDVGGILFHHAVLFSLLSYSLALPSAPKKMARVQLKKKKLHWSLNYPQRSKSWRVWQASNCSQEDTAVILRPESDREYLPVYGSNTKHPLNPAAMSHLQVKTHIIHCSHFFLSSQTELVWINLIYYRSCF